MKKILKGGLGCLIVGLLALTLVFVVGLWAISSYAGSMAESIVEEKTQFPTDMGTVNLSVLRGNLQVLDAKVQNPPGFPDPRFVDLREFKVDMKPLSVLGKRIHFDEIVVDLREVAMIVDDDRQINAMKFLEGFESDDESETEPPAFFIKRLHIKLDKATILNPQFRIHSPRTVDINLDMELTDVEDVEDIVGPLVEELRRKGMDQMAGLVLDSLLSLETYREALKDAATIPQELINQGGNLLERGGEAIQEGAEGVRGLFDNIRNRD